MHIYIVTSSSVYSYIDFVPDLSFALAKAFAEFVPDQVLINRYVHR